MTAYITQASNNIYSFVTNPSNQTAAAGAAIGIATSLIRGLNQQQIIGATILGSFAGFIGQKGYSCVSELPAVQKIMAKPIVQSICNTVSNLEVAGAITGAAIAFSKGEELLSYDGALPVLQGVALAHYGKMAFQKISDTTTSILNSKELSCIALTASTVASYTFLYPSISNYGPTASLLAAFGAGAVCYGAGTFASKALSSITTTVIKSPLVQIPSKIASVVAINYLIQNPIYTASALAVAAGIIYSMPSKTTEKQAPPRECDLNQIEPLINTPEIFSQLAHLAHHVQSKNNLKSACSIKFEAF